MYNVKIADEKGLIRHHFVCGSRQTLLDAARIQNLFNAAKQSWIRLSYACKVGGCGLCKVKVMEGEYTQGTCSWTALTKEERMQNITLACKTYPHSDLKIFILPQQKYRPRDH